MRKGKWNGEGRKREERGRGDEGERGERGMRGRREGEEISRG